jgi:hypothetical protein
MFEKLRAISFSEFKQHGCINCGCEYCYNHHGVSGGGCTPVKCGECGTEFAILADGLEKSSMGIGTDKEGEFYHPTREPHPRLGIPKHEYVKPDVRPETGGEFWSPRGIGYDLSGFVKSKQAGERIVKMFEDVLGRKPGTWLDYREFEPNWIQVKVQKEDVDLETLEKLTKDDGIITYHKIVLAYINKLSK